MRFIKSTKYTELTQPTELSESIELIELTKGELESNLSLPVTPELQLQSIYAVK